ncbi:hypothetical protein [Thiothrix lacustris]|uniref:hypothetical protein n=1 Tax=Thiothrix lacustris TaxID=525917 RepID=UPI0027E40F42|nr:hypothetical protein [Thiothrix lacustris]WMP18358.1 hypothetical protein RCS87_04690 [Thiothrix lacustris]
MPKYGKTIAILLLNALSGYAEVLSWNVLTKKSLISLLVVAHPKHPWNPRVDPATLHFIEAEDGLLYPLTATGRLTVERLRLNRPQLVNNRRQRAERAKELMLLQRANEMVLLLENTNREMSLPKFA